MSDFRSNLPEPFRRAVEAQLQPTESVVASCTVDLDDRLQFVSGLIVLTSHRLLLLRQPQSSQSADSATTASSNVTLQAWDNSAISSLSADDHGGLGHLEVFARDRRLASVNYTVGHAGGVRDLVDAFEDQQTGRQRSLESTAAEPEIPETEAEAERANVSALFRLLRFARRRIVTLLFGGLLTLATTAAGLIPPALTWPIVDDVLQPFDGQIDSVRKQLAAGEITSEQAEARRLEIRAAHRASFRRVPWYLGGMVGAIVLAWGLGWWQGWVLAWLSERISADLRNATYEHLQRLSLDFFSAKRTGDLVARISSDTDRICSFLSDSLMDFITDILMITGTIFVLFCWDPMLALATICTFPFIAWLTFQIRNSLTHGFLFASRAWADMTSVLADTIPGVRVVKAFAQERREVDRFRGTNDRIMGANDRVNRVWTFFWPMVALLNQIGLLVVWGVGAWGVYNQGVTADSKQGLSIGILSAAMIYVNRIYARLESMSRMTTTTQRAAASAQRLFEILDRAPTVAEPAHPVDPGKIVGAVELKDISFRYGNRQIIDGVSLQIRPGEMIGLVGTTGAGKSTLVNLVCRFYDVGSGAILVDGMDVRSFRIADYRKHIGIVLQEPFLFYGTIAENIAYGKPQATFEEIINAARAARAHEFILRLPDGYDSIVGERGQTLSGGERQRISIARALLIDPRLLILDEATSSVDTQTERQIQEALDYLVHGRTTIAIAHRLSTLRKADRLVVLEHGKIIEIGNHQELLAKNGAYARLYQAQMQLTRDFDDAPSENEASLTSSGRPNSLSSNTELE
ncbi:MAG: ATP-binding cassette domain-containing protein [Planctomycetes bacterium]|nr:ATP-binding cassette domain-containing protein [Planctomycetota bacterium]